MSNAGRGSVVILCQFLYRMDAVSLIPSIPLPLEPQFGQLWYLQVCNLCGHRSKSYHYHVVCLVTSAQFLPDGVLHRGLSNASTFSSTISVSEGHPVASYVLLLLLLILLPSSFHHLCLSLRSVFQKTVPTQDVNSQLACLCFIVCRMFISSLTECNTSTFFTQSIQLVFFIHLQHHIQNRSRFL